MLTKNKSCLVERPRQLLSLLYFYERYELGKHCTIVKKKNFAVLLAYLVEKEKSAMRTVIELCGVPLLEILVLLS